MYTLEDVKTEYYVALMEDEHKSFEEYLRENYVQIYDTALTFLGYELK